MSRIVDISIMGRKGMIEHDCNEIFGIDNIECVEHENFFVFMFDHDTFRADYNIKRGKWEVREMNTELYYIMRDEI